MKTKRYGLQPTAFLGFLALFLFFVGLLFFPPNFGLSRGRGNGSGSGSSGGGGKNPPSDPPIQTKKVKVFIAGYADWKDAVGATIDGCPNTNFSKLYSIMTLPPKNSELFPKCYESSMVLMVASSKYKKTTHLNKDMPVQTQVGQYVEIDVPLEDYKVTARLTYKQIQNCMQLCNSGSNGNVGRQKFIKWDLQCSKDQTEIYLFLKENSADCGINNCHSAQ
jgi:hypothetical protein